MRLLMISGGVRSGKSAYAEQLTHGLASPLSAPAKVLYAATGMRSDGEMDTRIAAHRNRRPAAWDTLEAPDTLDVSAYQGYDIVLLDSLSAWISNRLIAVPEDRCRDRDVTEQIRQHIHTYVQALKHSELQTAILVTDEVGWGGVAMSPLGRWFQDVIGDANQLLASRADEVIAVVSGLPWRLKG